MCERSFLGPSQVVAPLPRIVLLLPQSYKQSMRNILTAARVSSGPLWRAQVGGVRAAKARLWRARCSAHRRRTLPWPHAAAQPSTAASPRVRASLPASLPWHAQRQLNAKYRLLDEQQAEAEAEEQEQEGAEGAPLEGPSKPAGKARGAGGKAKGRGGRGSKKGAAQRRLVGSDSDSELEGAGEDEAAAVAAMEKLMLATAKKVRVGRGWWGASEGLACAERRCAVWLGWSGVLWASQAARKAQWPPTGTRRRGGWDEEGADGRGVARCERAGPIPTPRRLGWPCPSPGMQGTKAPRNGDKKAAAKAKGKRATKEQAWEEEEAAESSSSDDEAEEGSPQRQQRGAQRSRSGAAVLAQRLAAATKGEAHCRAVAPACSPG